jgi:hypothetical protein
MAARHKDRGVNFCIVMKIGTVSQLFQISNNI